MKDSTPKGNDRDIIEGLWIRCMVTAYILIVTEVGKEYDVVRKLKEMKSTVEVAVVYGEYDAFVKFMVDSLKELDAIVTDLRKISGIIRTITLISS